MEVRAIVKHGIVFIAAEDVAAMVKEVGATEETDVRTRLNSLAETVLKLGPDNVIKC